MARREKQIELNRRRTVFAPPSLRMASRHEARQLS
jgi:hypothetical protein